MKGLFSRTEGVEFCLFTVCISWLAVLFGSASGMALLGVWFGMAWRCCFRSCLVMAWTWSFLMLFGLVVFCVDQVVFDLDCKGSREHLDLHPRHLDR